MITQHPSTPSSFRKSLEDNYANAMNKSLKEAMAPIAQLKFSTGGLMTFSRYMTVWLEPTGEIVQYGPAQGLGDIVKQANSGNPEPMRIPVPAGFNLHEGTGLSHVWRKPVKPYAVTASHPGLKEPIQDLLQEEDWSRYSDPLWLAEDPKRYTQLIALYAKSSKRHNLESIAMSKASFGLFDDLGDSIPMEWMETVAGGHKEFQRGALGIIKDLVSVMYPYEINTQAPSEIITMEWETSTGNPEWCNGYEKMLTQMGLVIEARTPDQDWADFNEPWDDPSKLTHMELMAVPVPFVVGFPVTNKDWIDVGPLSLDRLEASYS